MGKGSGSTQVYENNKKRCPNCGKILTENVDSCFSCGYTFKPSTKSQNKRSWLLGIGIGLVILVGMILGLVSLFSTPDLVGKQAVTIIKLPAESGGQKIFSARKGDVFWIRAFGQWEPGEGEYQPFGPEGYPWEKAEEEFILREHDVITVDCNFASLIGHFDRGWGSEKWLSIGRRWGPMEYKYENQGDLELRINYSDSMFSGPSGSGALLVIAKKSSEISEVKGPTITLESPKEIREGVFLFPFVIQDPKGLKQVVVNNSKTGLKNKGVYKTVVKVMQGAGKTTIDIKAVNKENQASQKRFLIDGDLLDRFRKHFDRVDFLKTEG